MVLIKWYIIQVAYVCDVIANDPQLAEGYNGLGISQVEEIIDQNKTK